MLSLILAINIALHSPQTRVSGSCVIDSSPIYKAKLDCANMIKYDNYIQHCKTCSSMRDDESTMPACLAIQSSVDLEYCQRK